MSRFYGSVVGNRGEATRMGSAKSGITGHIRGWNIGARVSCYVQDGIDIVAVELTGGNGGAHSTESVGRWRLDAEDKLEKMA